MGDVLSRPSSWTTVEGSCHELGHTWCSSCVYSAVDFFAHVYLESFSKVYLPLFVVGNIARGKSIRATIDLSIPSALRSALFLAINAGGFITFICILRRLLGRFYLYSTSFLPCVFASFLAILAERKNRRAQLAGYVGPIAIETIYRMLKYRERVKPIPYGEVMIFSLTSAVLYSYYKSPNGLNDVTGSLLRVLLNPPGAIPRILLKRSRGRGGVLSTVIPFIAHTVLVSSWGFLIGYSIQTLLSIFQLGYRIVRNPRRITQAFTKSYNKKFGAFFATLTGFFSVLNSILFLLSVPRDMRILISGLFAGFSMLCIRSTSISLYAAAKAIELIYFKAVERGYVRTYYYGDVVLYTIFTSIIFHAALFEAHNLRMSYWKFLNRISGGRIIKINYDVVDKFGTDASQLIRIIRAQQQVEERQQQQQQQQQQQTTSRTLH